jgi:hypothetical protein
MNKLVRGEKGYVLIAALVVLLVLGLISGPLLSYMVGGLRAGHTFETGATELYAADAGAQDAIWKIQNGAAPVCTASPGPWCYNISDVNGRSVHVCIAYDVNTGTHIITSTVVPVPATGDGVAGIPSSTSVEAYLDVQYMDLASFLDNAIVSDTSITIDNGVSITGNVTSGGEVTFQGNGSDDDIDGTVVRNADLDWPNAEDLSAWYLDDVKDEPPYTSDTIDIGGVDVTQGALYRDGPLTIKNSGSDGATLKLTGTLFIRGDTKICYNTNNNNAMVLDLNGQTIFVASKSTGNGKEALQIGDKCTIVGSGCIIAVGDIYFKPNGDVGGADDLVLLMSVEGTTTLRPSGTFYGCIAGNLAVDVQSGSGATIINSGLGGGGDLNFPSGMGDDPNNLPPVTSLKIDSWEVSRLQ